MLRRMNAAVNRIHQQGPGNDDAPADPENEIGETSQHSGGRVANRITIVNNNTVVSDEDRPQRGSASIEMRFGFFIEQLIILCVCMHTYSKLHTYIQCMYVNVCVTSSTSLQKGV